VTIARCYAPLLLAAVLMLSGCGSDDAPASAAPVAGTSSVGDSAGSGEGSRGDVCATLEDQGATGAGFGPVQAWLPKDDVIEEIDAKLTPMTAVDAPDEVADAWATQQQYLEELRAAAEQLPEGGVITDPELYGLGDDLGLAQEELTDWWFHTCH